MGFKGDSLRTAPPTKAITKATKLTVSWNWRNFLIDSKIFLPHFMAVTIELKLSSRRIIPEAYLATSVPAIPIANPISAFLRAGASLVPSPVIATTWLSFFKPVAIKYLSSGDDRASTHSWSLTILKFSRSPTVSSSSPSLASPPTNYLNSLPSMTEQSPSVSTQSTGRIPAYLAMAMAVLLLSPVTILTLTPAL